jgi:formate C-acetyltransferase
MIADNQGAPFLLNFDERSMAGMLREAERAGVQQYINRDNVFDYAAVGCLENTMVGNDRSGTVDINMNILKAVELAISGGDDIVQYISDRDEPYSLKNTGPRTSVNFNTFEDFYASFETHLLAILDMMARLYDEMDSARAEFSPTPYLSCLVRGCAEKGLDITQGGAELMFVTVEGVTFATAVDSLLAVKYLVFDKKVCTMQELTKALRDNWEGHDVLNAQAKNKAPKYGRDDDEADALAKRVMDLWSEKCWQYKTTASGMRFRGGMLSWNYWVGDGYVMAASADGRRKGQFLSNAICPSSGADIQGPTANANSVGKVLGGNAKDGGDFDGYFNCLPNGASHTITFGPSLLRDPAHREAFKSYLRGYCVNGGTALQINVLDADVLREAQKNPADYRHMLVRVTGYNAYFTAVGRELQDEIIARESHNRW